ncbi:hypothetical protein RRG08_005729 [Elysia crispata]|uniref:Uncharacterized protein n=1 Tax=Elysia crispata TaxID=231223 RepID=A0AAE0YDI4_9GAST|nr:hypothetical protein RRG08_005729 [Elysia crispata]
MGNPAVTQLFLPHGGLALLTARPGGNRRRSARNTIRSQSSCLSLRYRAKDSSSGRDYWKTRQTEGRSPPLEETSGQRLGEREFHNDLGFLHREPA